MTLLTSSFTVTPRGDGLAADRRTLRRAGRSSALSGRRAEPGRCGRHGGRPRALEAYPYLHAARADLLRRLGRLDDAAVAYRRARELTANAAEQAFLDRRLVEVGAGDGGPVAAPSPN